jgi:hypothetical protein
MKWVSNFSLEARLPFSAARQTQVEQSFVAIERMVTTVVAPL